VAAGIFLLAGGTLPAMAQGSCPDLYNRMMGAHQSFGPQSGQYLELYNRYTQRCMSQSGGPVSRPGPRGPQCEELRLACENKAQLGERGEGNCRKYRETCQRPSRQMCEELRTACMHKDQLGEQGEGNCRRYRETCRR
jgi:hypothetical protein